MEEFLALLRILVATDAGVRTIGTSVPEYLAALCRRCEHHIPGSLDRFCHNFVASVEGRELLTPDIDRNDLLRRPPHGPFILACRDYRWEEASHRAAVILMTPRSSRPDANFAKTVLEPIARDIFWPNPIPPQPPISSEARKLFDSLLRDRSPIRLQLWALADALEEAGWNTPGLFTHLRGPDGHYKGCWAFEAVNANL